MTPNDVNANSGGAVKLASGLNFLIGVWLFVSPWVYGAYTNPDAWNSWIVGAVIAILAAIRFNNVRGLPIFSWVNVILGAWTFASPWIYGYIGNTGRFVNSLCVGVVVFILALTAWSAKPRTTVPHGM
jgi:hypothetical protein